VVAFRTGQPHPTRNLQWTLSWQFARWLKDKLAGADIVHAHMVGAWWAVAQVIESSTPFVATEHNQVNWTTAQIRALRPAAGGIDRFFAMGPAARRFAEAAGVPADVIRSARSPVAGLSAAPRSGLPTPRVTFAGRLSADKGPDLLIEALGLIADRRFVAYLLGDGPLRTTLLGRVEELGLSDRVFLPGWSFKPWTVVAGSSVHVVPSREEAWSQSAVLGLGLGVPVVGFGVDGLTDTLSGSRGVVVDAVNPGALAIAIADVLAGHTVTDRAAAIRYARQFTPSRLADFYLGEYSALLAQATPDERPLLTETA
jgi:glycosyltransferase involved in cell wall biosynthesis